MPTPESVPQNVPTAAVAVIEGFRTLRFLGGATAGVLLAWFCVAEPARALAGQETQVALEALVNFRAHIVLPWFVAVVFGWLWHRERRLRIATVKRENERNRELELRIDPGRTSSEFEE